MSAHNLPISASIDAGWGRVELALENASVGWGECARGCVVLSVTRPAPSVPHVSTVIRTLIGDPSGPSDRRPLASTVIEHVHSRCVWEQVAFRNHEPLRLPFALEIPYGTGFDSDTDVFGRVSTPRSEPAALAVALHVRPPVVFVELADLLAQEAGCGPITWRNVGTRAEATLRPLPGRGSLGRRLRLRLMRAGDVIHGRLDVGQGVLSALAGRPPLRFPFQVSAHGVVDATAWFRQTLRAIRSGDLPVPSQWVEPTADGLPVPAVPPTTRQRT